MISICILGPVAANSESSYLIVNDLQPDIVIRYVFVWLRIQMKMFYYIKLYMFIISGLSVKRFSRRKLCVDILIISANSKGLQNI